LHEISDPERLPRKITIHESPQDFRYVTPFELKVGGGLVRDGNGPTGGEGWISGAEERIGTLDGLKSRLGGVGAPIGEESIDGRTDGEGGSMERRVKAVGNDASTDGFER
jgi:hypothetical protein